MSARRLLPLLIALAALAPRPGLAQSRVGDLVVPAGDAPRRIVGYGIVTGLDGTGDRNLNATVGTTPTVRSIVNLLRRFDIDVPAHRLRIRNVAAVLVTAEVSPYLRAGGRFEVQVSAIGDASSLRGGVLWITPLVEDPNGPAVATAQGPLYLGSEGTGRQYSLRRGNSGRIPDGGVLEVEAPAAAPRPRLVLREPDLSSATRIAAAVNAAFGAGVARVEDPGAIALAPSDSLPLLALLAGVDTLQVTPHEAARVVIDARDGTVVVGGDVRIGAAVIRHRGLTLQVGGEAPPAPGATETGLVRVEPGASVGDVAAGLHAAGAEPQEMVAIFESLRAAGALRATLVVR